VDIENALRAVEGVLIELEVVSPAFRSDFDGSRGTVGQIENDVAATVATDAAGRAGTHGGTAAFHEADGGAERAVGGEATVALAVLGDEVVAEAAGAQGPAPAGFAVLDGNPVLAGGSAEEMLFAYDVEHELDGRVLDGFEFGERRFGSGLGVILGIKVVVGGRVNHHKPYWIRRGGENGLEDLNFGWKSMRVKGIFIPGFVNLIVAPIHTGARASGVACVYRGFVGSA
jgi:hypothetical protein